MQIRSAFRRSYSGFTLIEMIGVLAVIAILMSLLVPKVFEAINNARINNAAVSCQTVKTAIADHYAKYGTLLSSNGLAITADTGVATNFDTTLLTEGFLDKPLRVKIGTDNSAYVAIVQGLATNVPATGVNSDYNLDGGGIANLAGPASAAVVQAVIPGVTEADAKDFNDRLDGTALGVPLGNTTGDLVGRVKYAAPVNGLTKVLVYLTHR